MSFLHFNSRSLSQQFDELKHFLDSLPFTVDFLGFSETFITNSLDLDQFEISGYQLITDNRVFFFLSGGGVALFVKQYYVFSRRDDLKLENL